MLFCQQDRAILCTDCDVSVHTANELTLKHDRFLLTGFSLSMNGSESQKFKAQSTSTICKASNSDFTNTSSISEYLIEMLPGWQVEEFLDSFPQDMNLDCNMGFWVPQAPAFLQPPTYSLGTYGVNGLEGDDMGRTVLRKKESTTCNIKEN